MAGFGLPFFDLEKLLKKTKEHHGLLLLDRYEEYQGLYY
jgi:hypothetical protein